MKQFFTILGLVLFIFCTPSKKEKQLTINLKWNPNNDTETIDNALTGLMWALSSIGANSSYKDKNYTLHNNIITINLKDYNFNQNTYLELLKLNEKIVQSEVYIKKQYIDLGRYVTLLIGSSEHYYTFTGVPEHIDDILKRYEFKEDKGRINNSLVSFENRIIQYSEQKGLNQLFLSKETDSASGKTVELETIEIMENGQLRFGVFDSNGRRKNFGDPMHTRAGKPAKCMWCHESRISPLFTPQIDFNDFLSYSQFNDTLKYYSDKLKQKQNALNTTVDYNKKQEHTQMELLYISFMEPSAQRLSYEWEIPIKDVEKKLSKLNTHTHEEFPDLGILYDRKDVEPFAPYKSLEVSSHVREKSIIEVNHLK